MRAGSTTRRASCTPSPGWTPMRSRDWDVANSPSRRGGGATCSSAASTRWLATRRPASCAAAAIRAAAAWSWSSEARSAGGEGSVRARQLGDPLRAAHRLGDGAQGPLQKPHPLVLGAQLEQPLLGVGGQLDPAGELVGPLVADWLGLVLLLGDLLQQLGERRPRAPRGLGVVRLGLFLDVDQLDLPDRELGRVSAVQHAERRLPGDHDVHAPVVEALEHVGDPGGAPHVPRTACVVAKHDPDRIAAVERAPDHALVALLEDVQRHELAGKKHDRQLEDGELAGPLCGHTWILGRPTILPPPRENAPVAIDFEAEGLLDGLNDRERAARRRLLEELSAEGVALEELRRAVTEDRLALLPVERVLAGEGRRYTAAEVAERAGVQTGFLIRQRQALGLPMPDPGERAFTEEDVASAKRMKAFHDAGLPEEGMLEVSRIVGMAMAQIAAANRDLVGDAFLEPGDTELDVGLRYAEVASSLAPMVGPMLQYVLNLHLREQVRREVIGRAELAEGRLPGAADVAICFADLVGFTRLGEQVATEELGGITRSLSQLAS